ncbi:FecR family protein [Litoribaculum gwangyangense]|uniref:FecR family protein n=1 Tax=Litoribaculum gwangyangense TaxID=1130722 RepID=A0ABP9CXG4_9FLAO
MDKEYLIQKWLNEALTDDEKTAFDKLDDAELNQLIVENARHFKASHFDNLKDFNIFKSQYELSKNKVKKFNKLAPFLRIAGVLVVSLGIYFTFFANHHTHIETLASQKATIELPDHSIVELNALSSIEYNDKNWKNNRVLTLDGEAYFKVEQGKTFDVNTKIGVVTVVGTAFNVKQRNNYFEVKCFEGIVKVVSDSIERQLVAGDIFQILEGKFYEGKVLSNSPKWQQNISEFYAIPVKEVLSELERQYNIEVIIKNIDANRLFTGGFPNDNLENALIAITQPMNMTYELSSSKLVIIHGSKH